MAKPPAGSSLLFGALADFGRIKQRKNGSYRMVLKGVDEIDWFTDRPDRVAGEWSPKKLVRKWDGLFGDVEPNAQATFEMSSKRELVTFEMFKPKLKDSNQTLSFKVRGIDEKNKDLLTGLINKRLSNASLFIDDGTTADTTVQMLITNDTGANITVHSTNPDVIFGKPTRVSGYADVMQLSNGDIQFYAGGEGEDAGTFQVPVTLKNGANQSRIQSYFSDVCEPLVSYKPPPYGSAQSYEYSVEGGGSGTVDVTWECDEMDPPITTTTIDWLA